VCDGSGQGGEYEDERMILSGGAAVEDQFKFEDGVGLLFLVEVESQK
jgi:hypothetical protein